MVKYNYEELRKLEGKKVVLIDSLRSGRYIDDIYITDEMEALAGKEVTISFIKNYDDRGLFEIEEDDGGCLYCLRMVETTKITNEDMKETRKYTEFKKGDLVKIRTQKEIDDSLVGVKEVIHNLVVLSTIPNVKKIENKELIISDIIDDRILPYYIDGEYQEEIITKDMIEIVEENFVNNLLDKKQKEIALTIDEIKILEDLELIEEMKSKVNVKDFKKIIAGSLDLIPKDLEGIELVLHQWAFNKKEIYKLLGKNFNISKQIEYDRDEQSMEEERQKLYKEFPGYYYVLKSITNREFLDNKLHHTIDNDWNRYNSRLYKTGERVSKILDEAFKNDKFNTMLSDIIAQNKLKGILEISIDPIEYLLMSLNVSGWSSCHTMHKKGCRLSYGCYSAGIFSYMCDNVSLIAFRHDGKEYEYQINKQKIKAYSKNWRQMIWLNKDFESFVASRQYPNYVEEISKTIREMLEEQINAYLGEITWVHTTDRDKMQMYITNNEKEQARILHYNDILHGYDGDMCYKKGKELKKQTLVVGSYPVCPVCGRENLTINDFPFGQNCRGVKVK